ncbi:MAG: AAA family ATPase [Deltaproteobacteria bacterium]|nr:AAA family ATPase [Candidatus Zymogenaceae bacterium]
MKIAVSGKGGVGKTTLVLLLARYFRDRGTGVILVDADPDGNLAAGLGLDPASVVPISAMKELIAERTGARPGTSGGFFKLNPRVDDLPDTVAIKKDGIRLLVMGTVRRGGGGCICPESALAKALLLHLVLERDDVVIMDMEAGIEHLGRGTARAVDMMIVVVEPGRRSVETANRVRALAADIGLTKIAVVGNKVRDEGDEKFLREAMPGFVFLGFIPFSEAVIQADIGDGGFSLADSPVTAAADEIAKRLIEIDPGTQT